MLNESPRRDLVQSLSAVDTPVLHAVNRMIAHLLTVPDLRTAVVDPADFGIDEDSPQWQRFMEATEEFYSHGQHPAHQTHATITGHLTEFASAVNAVLADRGIST